MTEYIFPEGIFTTSKFLGVNRLGFKKSTYEWAREELKRRGYTTPERMDEGSYWVKPPQQNATD